MNNIKFVKQNLLSLFSFIYKYVCIKMITFCHRKALAGATVPPPDNA